jgi:hypothetical protein
MPVHAPDSVQDSDSGTRCDSSAGLPATVARAAVNRLIASAGSSTMNSPMSLRGCPAADEVRAMVTPGIGRLSAAQNALGPAISCLLLGCVSEIAADTTAGFLADAAPSVRAYFDYESAGLAAANGVMQLEGLHRVSPDNELLTLTLAQAYVAYAFGWVMDAQEQAVFALDYTRADHEQKRAYLMYTRATQLMFRLLRERDPHIDQVVKGDPDKLLAYLRKHYSDREEDIEIVFWTGVAWGSAITNSPEFDALVDFPAAKIFARHAVELDERFENAGPLALLGGFECSYPEQGGGDWKKGRQYFERSLALSGGRNHLHHINFARTYAVNAQDKALFLKLVHHVIEAGDQGNDVRLSNKVARRRAERYLQAENMAQWFPE